MSDKTELKLQETMKTLEMIMKAYKSTDTVPVSGSLIYDIHSLLVALGNCEENKEADGYDD